MATATQEATITDMLSGKLRQDLQAMTAKDKEDARRLDDIFAALQRMPQGPQRAEAQAAYDRANNELIKRMKSVAAAKASYNEIAVQVAKYSAGTVIPSLAGMGSLGVAPLVIAAIVAASALALNSLANAIGAWRGSASATEGYISQAARLVSATGTAIEQTGTALTKVALIVGVGVAGYLVWRNWDSIKGAFGKRSAAARGV